MPYRLRARVKVEGESGQFSSGGLSPRFVDIKKAKVWKRAGDLTLHLRSISPAVMQMYIDRWTEVIEFEIQEVRTGDDHDPTVWEWMVGVDRRRAQRESRKKHKPSPHQVLVDMTKENAELAELERLLAKYPNYITKNGTTEQPQPTEETAKVRK